ncbi:hypothetical protein O181_028297 [Austropuccinia psidii MF-1]|uniref:Uncharacterized protein n=1 Tax=Austropuccinia psidii MF-1 TaxID=1389203 RepID=A0A9Q3CUA9_9BASI|nr:hypothetical protein [Austropuccinia psidii MF-1]
MKILEKCEGELENALRSSCIEPCSTEEYINSLKDIVTRTKIGSKLKKLDIKIPNKPLIKKDKSRATLKTNIPNTEEKRKFNKYCGIRHLADNCPKKAKINEILETEDHNDKEDEFDSEKDTKESETFEIYGINIVKAEIDNIDLIYEVLDSNSNLPQAETSDTSLTNIQDKKPHRTKPEKGMGYTAGKSSISIFMVENPEEK